jgi:hypothetical protein
MKREGYLENVEVIGAKPKEMITVTFVPGRTLTVKRESAPGRRRYLNTSQTKPVLSGFGMAILSTSSGLLTDTEARAKKVGIPLDRALAAIAAVAFVPGRSERISLGQPFEVMVDYAAEPAALSKLYEMLRLWKKKRLIHVLGSCGGGRDVARPIAVFERGSCAQRTT